MRPIFVCFAQHVLTHSLAQVGNPVFAYACGTSTSWNAKWQLPATGTPGLIRALQQNGSPAPTCASVSPLADPTKWSIPWQASWSLKNY